MRIYYSIHARRAIQLPIDYMLRDIQSMLVAISISKKKLPGGLFKRLKNYIAILREMTGRVESELLKRSEAFPAMPVYRIGNHRLLTPLHIFVEDDDSGKYVSCLELPQIYGFGETEAEAMAMLEREILSLHGDVKASDSISEEYIIAGQLIDAALAHHG